MILCEIPFATPEFDEAVGLRDELLRKPLKLKFHPDDLAMEYDSIHLGVYTDAWKLVGCLTLKPISDSEIKMRQVAVEQESHGKGIGRMLVKYSEDVARKAGYEKMVLHARDVAIGFYEKLEYLKEGKQFKEVGIPHFKMFKLLK